MGDGKIPLRRRKPTHKASQEDSTWAAYLYSSSVWVLNGTGEDPKSNSREEYKSNSSGSKSNFSKDSASQKGDEGKIQWHGQAGLGTFKRTVNGTGHGAAKLHNLKPKEYKRVLKRSASCSAVRRGTTDEDEDWGPYLYNSFVDALYGIEDGSAKYHAIEPSGTQNHSELESEDSLEDALSVDIADTSIRNKPSMSSKRPMRAVSVQRHGQQRKGSGKGSGKGAGKGKGKDNIASGMNKSLTASAKGRIIF